MLRILGGPKRLCDGLTRRDLLHVGALGLLGLGLREWSWASPAGASDGAALVEPAGVRPGQVVHPAVPVRLAEPARDLRPQARGAPGDPRRVRLHRLERAGARRLRAAAPAGAGHGQGHGHPLGDASVSDPRRRLCHDGNPADRYPAGAQPARYESLAVHRIGRSTTSTGGGSGGAVARRSAVPRNLVLPGRSAAAGWARCPGRGRMAASSARRTTRSAPSSSAGDQNGAEDAAASVWEDLEPYRGITPESRFQLSAVSSLPPDLTLDRLDRRRTLLDQIEQVRRAADAAATPILGDRPPPRDGL